MDIQTPRPLYYSQVLDRAVQILTCFTADMPELRFAELEKRLGLNKTTLYRLLEALRSYGLIEQDPVSGKYHLGLKIFELGMLAIGRLDLTKMVEPTLERLREQIGETAHLCVFRDPDVVYIAKVESSQAVRIPSTIGRTNPAYCTSVGKAILAFLPEAQLDDYLSRTPLRPFTKKTITDPEEFKRHLRQVRLKGYAVDDQEILEGLRCVGSPLLDHTGSVVGAISVAGPATRITKSKIPEISAHVVAAARSISEKLGYKPDRQGTAAD